MYLIIASKTKQQRLLIITLTYWPPFLHIQGKPVELTDFINFYFTAIKFKTNLGFCFPNEIVWVTDVDVGLLPAFLFFKP